MKSPNTTILGVLTIVGAIIAGLIPLLDGNPASNPNWGEVGAGIMAGVGLILAKDETKNGTTNVVPFLAKCLLITFALLCLMNFAIGCATTKDAAGVTHTTIDWVAVDDTAKHLEPYAAAALRTGMDVADQYRKEKAEQDAAKEQARLDRAAFFGGCVAGVINYNKTKDVNQALESANQITTMLGASKPFLALAQAWVARTDNVAQHPSDVESILTILGNKVVAGAGAQ